MISKLLFGANGVIQKGYAGYGTITALRFDRETVYNLTATFGSGTENAGCNSSTKAYYGGGSSGSQNRIYDLIFSAKETSSLLAATLSVGRIGMGAINSTAKGYWMGGYLVGSNTASDEIDGIQFSNDTAINPAAVMSQQTINNTATVCSSTKGYSCGGTNSSFVTQNFVNAFTFSTENNSNLGAVMSATNRLGAGINSSTVGYIALGWIPASDPLSSSPNSSARVDKVVFSTETFSAFGSSLTTGRSYLAGFNNNLRGYFTGGFTQFTSGSTSTVDKITFASETLANVTTASWYSTYTTGTQNGGFL